MCQAWDIRNWRLRLFILHGRSVLPIDNIVNLLEGFAIPKAGI